MPLQSRTTTQTGGSGSDYLTGWGIGGSVHTLSGGDGNDFLIGDIGYFYNGSGRSLGTARDISQNSAWFTIDNPMVFDSSIPWVQIHHLGENSDAFYAVPVGAGETITVDTDASEFDTVIHIVDAQGNVLAENDDGGYAGDVGPLYLESGATSFVSYTTSVAQTLYIRLSEFGKAYSNADITGGTVFGGNIAAGKETMMYVSVTNFAATGNVNGQFNIGGDTLDGGAGNDQILGMGGNDLIFGGSGNDYLHGGEGYDTVAYSGATSGVYVDLAEVIAYDGYGTTDSIYGFEAISGSEHNDILLGDNESNALGGSGGNDFIDGRGGADLLLGGAGDDSYVINTLGDRITEAAGGGIDVAYTHVAFTLGENVEIGVSLQSDTAAFLSGNIGDNTLIVNSTASGNAMDGGWGNDVLYALTNTVMYGGLGDDVLVLQGIGNYAEGNAGDDVFIDTGTLSTIVEYADEGTDTLYSYGASVTLSANIEILALVSTVPGIAQNGTGNAGANTLIGTSGNNILSGLAGADFIVAGGGNDFIGGGEGLDVLQGNGGFDTFYYGALNEVGDVIQDWIAVDDSFAFAAAAFGFTAGEALVDGVNFFSSTNPFAFSNQASFLWDTDDTILYFDADGSGNGAAVLVADLQAFTDVSTTDFLFV